MPAGFEPKCLRISSRRVPPGSDPHARPPKSPPLPSPEALRSTVNSGRAAPEPKFPRARDDADAPPGSRSPRRRSRISPPVAPPGAVCPARPGAVCRSVQRRRPRARSVGLSAHPGARNAHPESRCTVASGSDNTIFNGLLGSLPASYDRILHILWSCQRCKPSHVSSTAPSPAISTILSNITVIP